MTTEHTTEDDGMRQFVRDLFAHAQADDVPVRPLVTFERPKDADAEYARELLRLFRDDETTNFAGLVERRRPNRNEQEDRR